MRLSSRRWARTRIKTKIRTRIKTKTRWAKTRTRIKARADPRAILIARGLGQAAGGNAGRFFSAGEHDAHEVGRVLGGELLHDARAVHLDGARADAEVRARLLVGGAGRDFAQHLALARGQTLAAGK